MKKLIFGLSLILWGLTALASAQTVTLEQAIRTTWQNSPQLNAQKALAGIYSDDTWRRFVPLEPTLAWEDNYSDTYWSWALSLTYPLPFKSLAFTQLDSANAEQQRWEFTAQKYDLAVAIAQAYMTGATAQAMIVFQRQNVQDLETITEAIRLQYMHGQSNQTQKISADLQLTAAQRDLKTAQDQLATAVELYARLMNISPTQVTGFELPEDVPASIIKELGTRTSGQLRDKANVDVGEANRATGFWGQIPDPTFTLMKDFYDPNNAVQPYNDSPTGQPNDYNFTISFALPILFPFREGAEAQRSENQGIVSREQAKLQLIQDNSAQQAGVLDYKRSKARYKQLHDRDLLLAETMEQAAVAAYQRGQLHFSDLMLARQTYAGLKTEDIQIRQEIVSAHLAGLVNDEEPEAASDIAPSSQSASERFPSKDAVESTASPSSNNDKPTALSQPEVAQATAVTTPGEKEDQNNSGETSGFINLPVPTAGTTGVVETK
jgi:outer membrane protein TolC